MECTNPNGCTLDGGEMVERMNAWRAVTSQALSREVRSDRITSVYPPEPDLIDRLKHLVAAEAVCCPFFEFTIQEQPHRTVVELTFPEEARSLVESVMGPKDPALS